MTNYNDSLNDCREALIKIREIIEDHKCGFTDKEEVADSLLSFCDDIDITLAIGDASTRKDEALVSDGINGLDRCSVTSPELVSCEISVVDQALANAAEILANFKACEAHEDGTLERKLEEWQACYAKLFTQMNALVQSTKPVSASLEKCAKALHCIMEPGAFNTPKGIAQTVLDAAGIKYVG